jgi:RNA polymerase sigma-70 factor (ECF subfamily)
VQEVLISIHKARHTYDCKRPLMPWLMAITGFRINDHLRKHYAQMRHKILNIEEFSDILTNVSNEESGPELVNEMLSHVNEKEQKILTMMYVTGYSAKEVGNLIGMNESAVKVAAHRATKKIKEKFPKL